MFTRLLLILILFTELSSAQTTLSVIVNSTNSCKNDGTATAVVTGGVPPYTYLWTRYYYYGPFTAYGSSISNLEPGDYFLTVTDASGSSFEYSFYIFPPFDKFQVPTGDTCKRGNGTSSVDITSITAPVSYLWSNGATTQTISGLHAGYYTVTVTDGNGCFQSSFIDSSRGLGQSINTGSSLVWDRSDFSVNISTTNANCVNGTATASVTGGISPYSYSWQTFPIQNTITATGLHADYGYYLTTTDAGGCENRSYFYINSASNFAANYTTKSDTCEGGKGTATAFAISGQPPYSYLWSTGQTTATINSISSLIYYDCTVTDANGCSSYVGFVPYDYSPLSVNANVTNADCSMPTGSIIANVIGGTSPYNYLWQTVPVQTTQSALNLEVGSYKVVIQDQNGCSAERTIAVLDNSTLALNVVKVDDHCSSNSGSATLNIAGGVPPYSIQWDTNPVQHTLSITGLKYGVYKATIIDASGCVRNEKVNIGDTSPVNLSISTTKASCIYNADGTAIVTAAGGTAPYNYTWSNGLNLSSIAGVLTGEYYINVADANGCRTSSCVIIGYDSITPCGTAIKGFVYADMDNDCDYLFNDYGINKVWVKCTPAGGYKFTNYSGEYEFVVPNAGNYNLDINIPLWMNWACGARPTAVNAVTGILNYENIALHGNALDIFLNAISVNKPVPGFLYHQQVIYGNQGSIASGNGYVKVYFDSTLQFNHSTPPPDYYNALTHELHFSFTDCYPYNPSKSIDVFYQVSQSALLGTQLSFHDTVSTTLNNDTLEWNNYYRLNETVVGPFDPNNIEVYPKGNGVPGYIDKADSILTYIVRFQNTGNYPAQNVKVQVQADNDLDISTFNLIGASAPCEISADNSNLITFNFQNINLLDSVMNEEKSHGYLCFSLNQNKGLNAGSAFNSLADIYFDFNQPVRTNTTQNTLTGIVTYEAHKSVNMFPNPSSTDVWITSSGTETLKSYSIIDITGKTVLANEFKIQNSLLCNIDFESANLSSGIYFVKVTTKNTTQLLKLIKQ